jgi:flagellar basal body-associated protein FliL
MDKIEKQIKEIEKKVDLYTVILLISIIINIIMALIIVSWVFDRDIEKETDNIYRDYQSIPITIYNNITINSNGTRSATIETSFPYEPS